MTRKNTLKSTEAIITENATTTGIRKGSKKFEVFYMGKFLQICYADSLIEACKHFPKHFYYAVKEIAR